MKKKETTAGKIAANPHWLGVVDRRCVRLIDNDLADVFTDDTAVNEALRTLLRVRTAQASTTTGAKTATVNKPKKKARA